MRGERGEVRGERGEVRGERGEGNEESGERGTVKQSFYSDITPAKKSLKTENTQRPQNLIAQNTPDHTK